MPFFKNRFGSGVSKNFGGAPPSQFNFPLWENLSWSPLWGWRPLREILDTPLKRWINVHSFLVFLQVALVFADDTLDNSTFFEGIDYTVIPYFGNENSSFVTWEEFDVGNGTEPE